MHDIRYLAPGAGTLNVHDAKCCWSVVWHFCASISAIGGPRGGVVTQRIANPFTQVRFLAWSPMAERVQASHKHLQILTTSILTARPPAIQAGWFMERVQYNSHTHLFRQVDQIKTARARLSQTKPGARLKILSFGCSIGDEVATLKFMFPDADIFGCDIEEHVLSIASQTVGSLGKIFLSTEENLRQHGPYDLILASAVLCLNPAVPEIAEIFPSTKFDEMVSLLDGNLAVGGILIVTNASYRFVDSPVAANYRTIRSDIVLGNGFVEVFDRASNLYLKRINRTLGAVILRRHGDYVPRDDEDLADSVFEKTDNATEAAEIVEMRISPPPENTSILQSFTRVNTEAAPDKASKRCIVVESKYDLCLIPATQQRGYILSTKWSSLVGEGFHTRPSVWHPLD